MHECSLQGDEPVMLTSLLLSHYFSHLTPKACSVLFILSLYTLSEFRLTFSCIPLFLFLLLLFMKSIYHPIGVRFTLHAFVAFWYLRFPQAGISLHDTIHPFPYLGLHPSLVEHGHTSGTAHASHRSRPGSLVTHTALILFSSFAEGWNSGFTRKTHHIILVHTPM